MPDSGSDIHDLVNAAQASLNDIDHLKDYRAMFVRAAFGGVQAGCALALSIDRLAGALLALINTDPEEPL